MKQHNEYDIIIVGGGHAGVEAAHIAARRGCIVLLVTMDKKVIGRMSCNPAIGGLAKGQMVREIDILGGLMGKTADESGIQFKILNRSKGRSVWSPRAQVDKRQYEIQTKNKIKQNSNIKIISGDVVGLTIKNYCVTGIELRCGALISSTNVVLTCGTFLSGKIHIGPRKILAGRMGEDASDGITESLVSHGFVSGRLKTGTPPRLKKSSIDFSKTAVAMGDKFPTPFSFQTGEFSPPNVACHTVRTNKLVHDVIQKNQELSPMFSGDISGIGPRYCPSIEDKVHRFSHHDSHHLFLEPEWHMSDQLYLNGFSTSLPENIQLEALRKIPGLKNVEFFRPGYAIEYDFFPPAQLRSTLESKNIRGLFLAGQINGTSGYEEAAAQGLLAGINASLRLAEKSGLVLSRASSYIGVMIDDLITKDTLEPYRMFTSRAEYRLMLRYSNVDERLFEVAKTYNLLNETSIKNIELRLSQKNTSRAALSRSVRPSELPEKIKIKHAMPAKTVLKRNECLISDFPSRFFETNKKTPTWSSQEILLDLEAEIKYEGYIKRHLSELEKQKRNEGLVINKTVNYSTFTGLSNEAIEKLSFVRPENLGQAMRVSGITPADISVLLVNLSK